MELLPFIFTLTIILLLCLFRFSIAADTMTQGHTITETATLVSKEGKFEMGFFSPGNSMNRYLGIWYKNIPTRTVVWVANRENPIKDSSGVILMINSTGHLTLVGRNNILIWSANQTSTVKNPILQLLDSGNLVLRYEKAGNSEKYYLWQSFDYPTDTLLPGMKLGWNLKTGLNRHIISWKSADDPSPGDFIWNLERHSFPEPVMWRGSERQFRSGPWNGVQYTGAPARKPDPAFIFSFVSTAEEMYFIYFPTNKSLLSRMVMNQTTYLRERYTWIDDSQSWRLYASVPRDYCDNYGLCGAYGNCIISESPVCQCLKGFSPKSLEKWNSMETRDGCIRNKPLNYTHSDGFVKYFGLKLPDTTNSWVNQSMNLKECRNKCLENSSCMAYTNTDIRGEGSGCAIWFGDLIDIKQIVNGGQDLYIRMLDSKLDDNTGRNIKIAVTLATIGIFSGIICTVYYIHLRKKRAKVAEEQVHVWKIEQDEEIVGKENLELPLFDLTTIVGATDQFSSKKKLGEGGFGPVYVGILPSGKEIAVKRLSKSSGQGLNELKNEVLLIAKLQHRNLVKLLGCCIQGEEKLLVYEYMPNKSLDSFIFGQSKAGLLDWSKRFKIICGIARGLLYLHQDSILRIIHRDLKASNILLDNDMTPKISDFGTARIFGGDQTNGKTRRVIGTFGYMAPEYAFNGKFSTKSDVFSFGVLVLEVISGIRSSGFNHFSQSLNLIGHAWTLWSEGRSLELIDECLMGSCYLSEVERCIHVSLLCVQRRPEDRPEMSSVILMFGSDVTLPHPKQPAFFIEQEEYLQTDPSKNCQQSSSTIITLVEPR